MIIVVRLWVCGSHDGSGEDEHGGCDVELHSGWLKV